MKQLSAFLFVVLVQTLWASAVEARGSALSAVSPCTLDVVLVTFTDTTGVRSEAGGYPQYHLHDRPYGDNPGESSDEADSSYTLSDFERLFSGGYDGLPDFFGTNEMLDNGHTLPEVFGSVRAYFDSVSNGAFELNVRIVNPDNGQGYPRWVELRHTKEHYAEIASNDTTRQPDRSRRMSELFWDDAEEAAQDSVVNHWYTADPAAWRLPTISDPIDRRLRRKVLYLYSGATFTLLNTPFRTGDGLLHPQVDTVTWTFRGTPFFVGHRYVMGERQGWGNSNHNIDEFAGIGMHAHEIGHLLGLTHGQGRWEVPINRYEPDTNYVNNGGANMLGWTLMQGGGEQGPRLQANDYFVGYRSCPNPINPFYLMDLGWINPTMISESRDNYPIAAGTTHQIDRGGVDGVSYLLNRRTTQPFGGRYLAFYDYAVEGREQGLMVWRREIGGEERPILIVADERRYRDARPAHAREEYFDMLSDPFPGTENVRAVNALRDSVGLRQKTDPRTDSSGNPVTHNGENMDPGRLDLALTNITYDSATDMIRVDIHMAPPGPPTNVTAVVSNGQATLSWRPPVPSVSGLPRPPPPSYQYRQSTNGTWGDEITVATNARSQMIELVPGTDYAFEVRAVNPVGSSDWVSPLVLEGPTAIEFPEVVPPESGRRTVANYTATDPEGDAIEWLLRGTDAGAFLLNDGLLTFQTDPDFENPPMGLGHLTDAGRAYHVTVQARAGQQSAALDVAVTVTNEDDPGTVTLSPLPPQAGVQLTATLMDQDDGVTEAEWTWQRQAPGTTTWPNLPTTSEITSGETQSSYTPQQDTDVGHSLQVRVSYQDGASTEETDEKNAHSAATAAVIGVPDALESLVAAAGDQSVELTWEAPANNGGTDITDYKYRYRSDGGMTWEPPQDEDEDKEGTSLGLTTSHPVGSLTNGETYVFEVWAVNAQGDGPALTAEVTLNSAPMISGFESVSEVRWDAWYGVPEDAGVEDSSFGVLEGAVWIGFPYEECSAIGAPVVDSRGDLWIPSYDGLYRWCRSELPTATPGEPHSFYIEQNDPNPLNQSTHLGFTLQQPSAVSLQVFNARGELVATLVEGVWLAGTYQIAWDGRDAEGQAVRSGLYRYQLDVEGRQATRKMLRVQ